jgi:hypothetical protein
LSIGRRSANNSSADSTLTVSPIGGKRQASTYTSAPGPGAPVDRRGRWGFFNPKWGPGRSRSRTAATPFSPWCLELPPPSIDRIFRGALLFRRSVNFSTSPVAAARPDRRSPRGNRSPPTAARIPAPVQSGGPQSCRGITLVALAAALRDLQIDTPGRDLGRKQSWSRLSEQNLRVDKWSVCRVRLPSGGAAG